MKRQRLIVLLGAVMSCLLWATKCTKVEYTKIEEPAYLRVFNNMNYVQTLGSKDDKVPYLCMLINPTINAGGLITGAEIVGDFLDQRDPYAPPYPSHVGNNNSVHNPEFPGKQNVLVGPVLNGFDLSSWAQVPSGSVRIVFAYRPKNTVPFFELEDHLRKDFLIDTSLNLGSKEVYTLHVLQKDFVKKENGILLRQENFHKLPLSDSLVYVNFYNMSAKGFWEADLSKKDDNFFKYGSLMAGIKDDMNVFLSVYENAQNLSVDAPTVAGYKGRFVANMKRNSTSPVVSPYASFPLWASNKANGVQTDIWQRFDFFVPGMDITNNPFHPSERLTGSNWASVNCLLTGNASLSVDNAAKLPNMLVNIHSGKDNPRTFATVNTIEVVNGRVYLTTIQRKYAPPIY